MRWIVFLIVLLVLLAGTAVAETQISVATLKNDITPLEEASFNLEITNQAEVTQRYSIYSLQSGQDWNVDPSPLQDRVFSLAAGQSKIVKIVARPLQELTPKIYYVHVTVETDLGERYEQALKIYLASQGPVDYLPAFLVEIDMDEKITPKEPLAVKLFLENRNPLNLTNLKLEIQSDIPEFNKEAIIDLPPMERKTVEFSIVPNEFQQPKDYTLFFVFSRYGEVVKVVDQKIEILSLLPPFSTEMSKDSYFLKHYRQVVVMNEGNVKNTQKAKVPTNFFEALFTTKARTEKIEGQRYFVWELELAPGETETFGFITNYRWLIYILVIVLLFAGFYYYVQSPVSVNKEAIATRAGETLSEVKVTLEVRNRSRKPLKEVEITDYVPSIANVQQGLELGTLKPQEIRSGRKRTKVVWGLAELDVHEHRLVTYKIKTKLNVVGTLSLPRATVEFKKGRKKRGKAYSNIFRLST
ncbi:MAG: hypothetical protein KKH52_02890 [Nanoarchaeota archaeon]|nr:hypothetical protein [Nanoarchaeota archaeon]MBU1622263.1 hypothetical protein [Nanoarchaeota archaeon]MBU1974317.1 hypothetical protein [Nanoarchaeota archaeon]